MTPEQIKKLQAALVEADSTTSDLINEALVGEKLFPGLSVSYVGGGNYTWEWDHYTGDFHSTWEYDRFDYDTSPEGILHDDLEEAIEALACDSRDLGIKLGRTREFKRHDELTPEQRVEVPADCQIAVTYPGVSAVAWFPKDGSPRLYIEGSRGVPTKWATGVTVAELPELEMTLAAWVSKNIDPACIKD